MFSISQDFAPPFKLIAPFFIIGSLFYLFASIFLFGFDAADLTHFNPTLVSFTHLFLLGFVMMIIFGAMAQLVPVVLEVGHFAVELFYAIWPLLLIGSVLMVVGFANHPALLPYGGVIVLTSMMIFVSEIFLTIRKVKKFNIVMSSVLLSNTFLFFGIIVGLIMALGYAGTIDVDVAALLRAHVYLVIGGYITITLMGLSVVLLPMFGLSHGFSLKPLEVALYMMGFGVVSVVLSSLLSVEILAYIGYALSIVALLVYFYLITVIYKTRARKEIDIYTKSLLFAYFSLVGAIVSGVVYFLTSLEPFLLVAGWLMFFGFFGFAITGHIYKIIPFLVWFERFSPLVGKQKVPMLADMLPERSSEAQLVFNGAGVVLIAFGLGFESTQILHAGASFMIVGAAAFVRSVFYMINFKESK